MKVLEALTDRSLTIAYALLTLLLTALPAMTPSAYSADRGQIVVGGYT